MVVQENIVLLSINAIAAVLEVPEKVPNGFIIY